MRKKINSKSVDVLLNSFWTHGGGISGGDQMAIQLFGRIYKKFGSVCFYTTREGEAHVQNNFNNINCMVTSTFIDKFGMAVGYILRTFMLIPRLIISNSEIIYSGSDFFPDVYPAFIAKLFKPKKFWVQCIFHIYPHWRDRPGNILINMIGYFLQKISINLAKKSDAIICINSQVRRYLLSKKIDRNKINLIQPGVDLNYIDNIKSMGNKNLDGIYLGRLNITKGVLNLPEIWSRVTEKFINAKLFIIGGGSEEILNELKSNIRKYGLENNIVIMGYLESESIYELMKSSKIFVFPSYEEGFGIAIVEALACKQRVVAWKLEVYEELFGAVVDVCPIGNVEFISNKIIEIFEENNMSHWDPREVVERYSWDAQSVKLYKLLVD